MHSQLVYQNIFKLKCGCKNNAPCGIDFAKFRKGQDDRERGGEGKQFNAWHLGSSYCNNNKDNVALEGAETSMTGECNLCAQQSCHRLWQHLCNQSKHKQLTPTISCLLFTLTHAHTPNHIPNHIQIHIRIRIHTHKHKQTGAGSASRVRLMSCCLHTLRILNAFHLCNTAPPAATVTVY